MEFIPNLNKRQKEAVFHSKGPLLVVAGAGTGKTKVITSRIAHLIKQGVSPDQILAITFTNKAAQEMKERVGQLAGLELSAGKTPTIGTFHFLAAHILRERGEEIGIPSNFSILNEKESLEIIKSGLEELGLDLRQFKPALIQNLISREKSRLNQDLDSIESRFSGPEDYFTKTLGLIRSNYTARIRAQKALDFDDLILKTVSLFEQKPEILRFFQEKWPYIHIDEYQDTDLAQGRLINLFAEKSKNICAVGDEDQSIYGFRGADFTVILNFEKNWPNHRIISLERNYRSTGKILDAANAVISKNRLRRPKNLFTKGKTGTKLAAFAANNETEEAEFIAAEIKKLLQNDSSVAPIAILCRANFQFRPIENALLRHSLLYETASNQDSLLGAKQPVRLMTIHAAKGLEFQCVFMPGLEKGLLPYLTAAKPHTPEEAEEERRLFYVGLTRAKNKVFLSWARYRQTAFAAKKINQPSPFLSDIPQNLITWRKKIQ